MATGGWCGLGPLLFRKKAYGLETMKSSSYVFSKTYTKKPKLSKVARSKKSSRCKDNFVQMMELRKKILILRDIIDLPTLERSVSINELVVGTMEDLQKLYPEIILDIQYSEMKATCIEQSLSYFCTALKSIGDSWMLNHEWRDKSKYNLSPCRENSSFNEIVESVLAIIDCIISMANERFDVMDEYVNSKGSSYSRTSSFGKSTSSTESCSETNSSCCSSPETPTSVLANFRNNERKSSEKENVSCSSPLLWSLRVQAVEKLNPIDVKHLLLPRLSHCGVNVRPAPNAVAIIKESMINVDDKLTSKKTDVANGNEEIEVSVTKEGKSLTRVASQRADRNEKTEVSDIKEEKLSLSRVASQKENRNEKMEVSDIKEEKLSLSRAASQKADRNEEMEVSDIKEEKLNLSRATSQKADRNEEMEVSDIKEEKLNLSRATSQKADRNEEMEVSDIKEEKLNLSRAASQKADRNEEIEVSDIKEENLNLSRAASQKANRNEEMEMSDIKEEKLNLSKAPSQKTDRNEEMEMSDIKQEKSNLSRAASQKVDRNEEMEVNDIKEEKLNLSRAASRKEIVERTNDIDSLPAATVVELPAPELLNVASEPSPPLRPVLPPPPPLPECALQSSVVVLQQPTPPAFPTQPPPPPPPPMMQQNAILAQQLSQPPPPPPLPEIKVLPTAAAPMAPPPPPASLRVIATVVTVAVPPPPPPSPSKGMVNAGVPPPPPMAPLKGGAALAPPPPMPQGNGLAPPPPPPGGAGRSLRPKKASTKLKRSQQLGNLYRTLKGKVEGSNQNLKSGNGKKGGVANSAGGKQGMADALAEMTKRSAYFQQIEEDVRKHAKSITELKSSISSFQSSDMNELLVFHKSVESVLEHLTDESQVLARFEGFPTKKLETMRIAVALYLKLDAIVDQLQNWKIVSPTGQLLDRVESYFTKIKGEVDALDRTKDDEAKRFRSHGIQFDFGVLIRIKEAMVDVSSNCMELALKERREMKAAAEKPRNGAKPENSNKGSSKILWRAFQFAYRVYTFAGGHDERADRLTRELALEIESESQHL